MTEPKSLQRTWIRCFAAITLIVIAIDTAPNWKFVSALQEYLRPALNVTGLWQGDWPLFAPNPVVNNGWISAEFYTQSNQAPMLASDGKPLSWNSPIWSEFNSWTKFYRFRHINYFNRAAHRGQKVIDDLADFVARTELGPEFHFVETEPVDGRLVGDSPPIEIRLFMNRMQIVLPDDGSLPSPEETTWMSVSSNLTLRKYSQ
jgi:hypothetical protein